MISHISNNIRYFTFHTLTNPDIIHAVVGRSGGVSPHPYKSLNISTSTGDSKTNVAANVIIVYNALNLSTDTLNTVHQVHGQHTITVDNQRVGNSTKADALITKTKGMSLFMKFADCAPLLIYDPYVHAIGLGHAGWRGTLAGIGRSMINAMRTQFGCKPHNLIAAIGPCIAADRYIVGEDVANLFQDAYPDTDDIVLSGGDSIHLDLVKANTHSLTDSGVQSIETSGLCTAKNNADFFSHRVEGKHSGRFSTIMSLK
jgi:YfiH family protein